MAESAIRGVCPQCGRSALHALLPLPAPSSPLAAPPPAGAQDIAERRRVVCSRCEKSWEAAVLPWEQFQQLRAAAESLAEAKRQIAMLRLIMSKDQLQRAEKPNGDVIKLCRAA